MKKILFLLVAAGALLPAQTVIKMGTLAPDGSPWHQVLQRIGERWRIISGGKVKLVIYPGGVLGDEPDLVKKMRIGQIQAVALSGVGMSDIEPGVMCLQIPMMFTSYEELDYVRDRIAPRLEKMIDARGFLVLNWGDAGWVHFFSRKPVSRLDDLKQMKLFTWAGDSDAIDLYQANGFRPVPLAATDILSGLQTGLIDAVPTTPLYALLNQSFGLARNMCDVKWAPLVGATLVSKSVWDKLPADQRAQMLGPRPAYARKVRQARMLVEIDDGAAEGAAKLIDHGDRPEAIPTDCEKIVLAGDERPLKMLGPHLGDALFERRVQLCSLTSST